MPGVGLVLLFVAWAAATLFFRAYRIWLPFYILGSVGCAFWLILAGREFLGLDRLFATTVAWTVHGLAQSAGIPTRIFENAPGVLLVLVISQEVGWTMLQVGVESSGLLEVGVLTGLLLVYPGWTIPRRLLLCGAGILLTMAANVLRVLIIVAMLHFMGKEALLLAHTFVGKAVFFVFTIAIYSTLITRPTVRQVARGLRSAEML